MATTTFKASAHLQEGVVVKVSSRNFEFTIDEPKSLGGTDTGMNPVEVLLGSLGACQSIVARVYAKKFNINLEDFRVEVEGDLDLDGFFKKADVRPGYSDIRYTFYIKTDAPRERVEEFVKFLEETCPVGDTIANLVNLKLNGIVIEN
ncbi:OsmC family peroxiredoxin [Paenibacillus chitinolyticus]|uniref:OsmC family peroxiredoxin n=1 Tax=Paenibacillus chitinolyticus TaxID=79263 RepID=A0A410WX28_9BACL|nr:OsmC family protein [Paenibacillus chitinolyticus]MCY9591455.1 OsmC family protein [Paenibacillus chitinolyticus]MCY9598581.1 OsmC family protein [Paenibacillus chitinolyticus]QAV18791.1 OsmC family peroxiredoxin [Paenibacillus chitinolyticus]